ncbi:MAG: sugar phosphate isomerase/epimerase family protein [Pyrinomonadaceae bacterium]
MAIGIGVNSWVWTSPFTTASTDIMFKAAEMGFNSFTIAVEDPSLIEPDKIKSVLQQTNLRPFVSGAFGPTRDLTHEEPKYRQESLDYIHATLKLCEKWGANLMVGPAYSAVGKRRRVSAEQKRIEWERAVDELRAAGRMAADHGVVLALEPLNRFETDLINTAEQVVQLVRDVDDPSVKIHLDTFHMNIEEKDIYRAVTLAGPDLVYVDASESDRGAPGSGQVDWEALAQALREINYAGDCVIESFTPECQTIAAAAAIWRPLAPSQDALAQDGLKFLRQLFEIK